MKFTPAKKEYFFCQDIPGSKFACIFTSNYFKIAPMSFPHQGFLEKVNAILKGLVVAIALTS